MRSVGLIKPLSWQPLRGATRRLRRISVGGLRRLQYTSLLLTRSYWGLMYALNWWDIIDEHFVLGGAIMFDDLDRLQGLGVDAVLNLCAERADNWHQLDNAGIAYLWLPVTDVFPPTFDQIMQGMSWIERQLQDNRTIYVHCAVGVGRSATLLACWLLYAKRMTVSQALHFLKTRRPQVGLTRLQIRRLEEFDVWLARRTNSAFKHYLYTVPATSTSIGGVRKSLRAPRAPDRSAYWSSYHATQNKNQISSSDM